MVLIGNNVVEVSDHMTGAGNSAGSAGKAQRLVDDRGVVGQADRSRRALLNTETAGDTARRTGLPCNLAGIPV